MTRSQAYIIEGIDPDGKEIEITVIAPNPHVAYESFGNHFHQESEDSSEANKYNPQGIRSRGRPIKKWL